LAKGGIPLFGKEGLGLPAVLRRRQGRFYEFINLKIPLHPPFSKGEYGVPLFVNQELGEILIIFSVLLRHACFILYSFCFLNLES